MMPVGEIIVTAPVFKSGHHDPDLPITLIFEEVDLVMFFPTAKVITVSYPLDLVIILPVDLGNLHFHFPFIGKSAVTIIIAVVGIIMGNDYFNIVPPVIVPSVVITSVVFLSVVVPSVAIPVTGLGLCSSQQTCCYHEEGKDFFHTVRF